METTTRVAGARRWTGWQARIALLAAIWGFSFLLIKQADPVLGPLWVAALRIAFGAATVAGLLVLARRPLPALGRVWGHCAVAAVLANVIPFTLFALGETRVSSVLAGIWNGTTPLFAVPAGLLLRVGDRPTRLTLAGLGVGFAGVVLVLAPWRGAGGGDLLGDVLCLLAAVSYGLGFPYTRRFLSGSGYDALQLAGCQLVCGTAELLLVALATGTGPHGMGAGALTAVAVLGVLGTGLAYVLNFSIIADAGPTTASTVTYLIPIVSTAAGVLLLHEPLGWWQPLGAAVVLLGAAVVQGRVRLPVGGARPPVLARPVERVNPAE